MQAGVSDSAATPTRVQKVVLYATAGAVTLAAWLWLIGLSGAPHRAHMAFMSLQPHGATFGEFASAAAMWLAMTAAMMTPTVMDWLLTFAALSRDRGAGRGFGPVAAFGAGYFVVWVGYSLIAAAVQLILAHAGFLEMHGRIAARAGGAILVAAGLIYFTPLNRACLLHCRNPLTFFLARWKDGPRGGFGFGLTHGAYCVGCCWAVMATAFAMGVMNLMWMAFLTLLISVEKLAPHGARIAAVAAGGMTIWGLVLLF